MNKRFEELIFRANQHIFIRVMYYNGYNIALQ